MSLCASSHDVSDPRFQLVLRPITIENDAWIAAEAFVGPAVRVGAGALLGARGVAMRNLQSWTIYSGNPARPLRERHFCTTKDGADAEGVNDRTSFPVSRAPMHPEL